MAHTKAEFDHVKKLMSDGLGDYRIAALHRYLADNDLPWRRRERPPGRTSHHFSWRVLDAYAYCYLLGCYLGDGTLAHPSRNGWEIRDSCDQRYADIIDEIEAAAILTSRMRDPRVMHRLPAAQ